MRANRSIRNIILALGLLGLLVSVAGPAAAASCCDDWTQPFICRIDFVNEEHVTTPTRPGEPWAIWLRPGEKTVVDVQAFDQRGNRFAGDEIRFQFVGDGCRQVAEAEILSREQFVLRAGDRTGSCDLAFWVPGNRNLDRTIRVSVERQQAVGEREAVVAERLYRGILGREPSVKERRALALVIESGGTRDWVANAFRSQEFLQQRAGLGAERLLADLYQGLLGRAPDASGIRSYQTQMARRQYAEVVSSIMDSREFRDSVAAEVAR